MTKKTAQRRATAKSSPHARKTAHSHAHTHHAHAGHAATHAKEQAKAGFTAAHEIFASGADEAQKAHDKVMAIGREGAEKFARSAETAAQGMNEAIDIGRGHIQACVECSSIAADMTRSLSTEMLNFVNEMLTQNMEVSQEAMNCRTISDFFELHNRAMQHTMEQFFNESNRFSELFFQYASEAAEPLKERVADATDRLSKVVAA